MPDSRRQVLLPFAAFCEIGCTANTTIAGPACGEQNAGCPADPRCLGSAEAHLGWAETDPHVVGLFIYRLKDLWQASDMSRLDACRNPWGTGLGLVDRCGAGGAGGYAMPLTLAFYQENVSVALTGNTEGTRTIVVPAFATSAASAVAAATDDRNR